MKKISVTVVPAHPGWHAAIPVRHMSGDAIQYIDWEPVIAWAVEAYLDDSENLVTITSPVTVSGERDDYGIRNPDGDISLIGDRDFQDERELVDYLNENRIAN